MSAYYDLYETPVPEGEEPKSLHARVCSKGTISGKEFMERVFREEHMPHAMVVGIVQAITTTLGDWLAKGYTVEIEGLGFFSTTLKCTHPVMNKKEVRAESVKMSTVKFRPGIEFKRYVAGKMELERADKRFFPDKPKAMGDMVAREKSMMAFFWKQVKGAVDAGAESLYLAMFDEIDEGTAFFKCTNTPPVGESSFITYEGEAPDHYLWLAGEAAKYLRGELRSSRMPVR